MCIILYIIQYLKRLIHIILIYVCSYLIYPRLIHTQIMIRGMACNANIHVDVGAEICYSNCNPQIFFVLFILYYSCCSIVVFFLIFCIVFFVRLSKIIIYVIKVLCRKGISSMKGVKQLNQNKGGGNSADF